MKLVIFDGNLLGGYQRENEKLKILAAVFSKCSNSENKFLFRVSAPKSVSKVYKEIWCFKR